jgi:D-glucosaminate-6-phosphate ammonia-lyase
VPVVVDAAYMSYPTELIAKYGNEGADLVCFSAKYFWGPNGGGFVYGRKGLIDAIAQIDFTRFESGAHLIFGRAFKLDRATVVATTLALQEWLAMDHAARWESYRRRAESLVDALGDRVPAAARTGCFTLDERLVDEPVNSVLIRPDDDAGRTAAQLEELLAAGIPSVRAVAVDDTLSLCLETVAPSQDALLVERVVAAFADER